MKKKLVIAASALLIAAILAVSVFSASAAVFVQDGKYKYQLLDDGTVTMAGYISDTVDDVTVPRFYGGSTVVGIANFAMENNSKVRSIDFMEAPDLEKIGMYAFRNCSSLESVLVPDSITNVDVSAFRDCSSLTDVTFYGNQRSVPVEAFYNCSALSNVRLSARLQSIQSAAFAYCVGLEYLELSDTLTYIAPNAFEGDTNLTLGVWYGSYAYSYAKDNNINYVLLDGVKLGDANGDGQVNINDVTAIQRHLAQLEQIEGIYLYAAESNQSGDLDISDATTIQMYIAQYNVPYPIGEVITQ
ncbi:MAG: leucine-rich repeat protein [Ruminococcus sp.]|nr:leucine-rich repeat protein [Ruminococcus sp.]